MQPSQKKDSHEDDGIQEELQHSLNEDDNIEPSFESSRRRMEVIPPAKDGNEGSRCEREGGRPAIASTKAEEAQRTSYEDRASALECKQTPG